jgi:hypothetical protein
LIVSGFRISPLERSKISSGESKPKVMDVKELDLRLAMVENAIIIFL